MYLRSPVGVYRTYTYSSEFTLVRRYPKVSQRLPNLYWYYRTYPYMKVPVGPTKLILVLRILYLFYEVYPGLMELILVLQNLYMYFKSYTCNTELILVLRNLYGSYGSYSCAKVPVGTMSRNRSGSYHLQG